MLTILCISFVLFMVLGVPIAICLGASAALAIFWASPVPLLVVAQKLFQGMNNFSYLAIPLFLLAGNIMAETKISERLVALAYVMFGKYPGGMSNVATASSAFFSTISGSAPATTAAVGSVLIPSMTQRNYPPASSAAVVAASGALGLILPPSLTMVIYGVISGVSIGDMFMNGIVPGLVLVVALLLTNYVLAKRRGLVADKTIVVEKFWDVFRRSIFALLMPVIIFAGIYSGAFTATESAAVACVYGLLVGFFIYKTLTLAGLINAFKVTVSNTTVVLFLMACANAFAYIITAERVPQMAAGMLVGLTDSPLLIMFLLLGFLLLVGMFLDNVSALVLLVPTLMSIIGAYGIDPMYFGVFAIIALAVGQFTPPVGLNVFIAARIAKQPVESVFVALVPYVLVYILVLVLFIFFPSLLVMYKS